MDDLKGSAREQATERTFSYSLSQEEVIIEPNAQSARRNARPNRVSTTRFTPLTWLPLSLFYQFHRVANLYFLVIAIIVLALGEQSPKNWKSKVFPFAGVLLWTALKDLVEDLRRRRDDEKENRRKCLRCNLKRRACEEVEWQDILAGDLLCIKANEPFPADLVLMQVEGGGSAFISTVNLDGEGALKERFMPKLCSRAMSSTLGRAPKAQDVHTPSPYQETTTLATVAVERLRELELSLRVGPPEAGLAEVRGKVSLEGTECPAGEHNFLPRGCVLRNTAWVLACAVYVGCETKTRLNAAGAVVRKVSAMQRCLNRCVELLLVGLLLLVSISASVAQALGHEDIIWPLAFAKYSVTFYHVVPVSLYIMFETFKLLLGIHVNLDQQMCDWSTSLGAVARTADLMEELGQVDFIFSDKTGTLTANEMRFAKCCVDGSDLGDFREAAFPGSLAGLAAVQGVLADPRNPQYKGIHTFYTCLATCHSLRVEEDGIGRRGLNYLGQSPDEVALVEAAADAGIVYKRYSRDPHTSRVVLEIHGPGAQEIHKFEVLHELSFTADRKRMSVLVREDDKVWCITKGADNVMTGLLDRPLDHNTAEQLHTFSQQGLRTLVVARSQVDPTFAEEWVEDMQRAQDAASPLRERQVAEVASRLEKNLELVGVTAVEDRLQEEVPWAIRTLKDAGIRLWVLTGDKVETAVDIAKSCALFTDGTSIAYAVEATCFAHVMNKLLDAKELLEGTKNGGLVLDGSTVKYALTNAETRKLLYELGMSSCSCVCCRLTPSQKRELVELARQANPKSITLAIGDGANDVPMLEGANIGVGIRGKEGAQATQVSDYTISRFRFLVPLLLCHGWRAYRRVSIFLLYYLYKNVALVVADVVWSIQDNCKGRIAYPEYLSMGFNVFFTSWHILFVLGYDRGIPDHVVISNPELYREGPARKHFNCRAFASWMAYAVWHGLVCWLVPNVWYGGTEYTTEPSDFWKGSCASFLITVFVVNAKLQLSCMQPLGTYAVAFTALANFMTIIALFCLGEVSLGYELSGNEKMKGIPSEIFSDGEVLGSLALTSLIALSLNVVEMLLRYIFKPSLVTRLRRCNWDEAVQEVRKGETVREEEPKMCRKTSWVHVSPAPPRDSKPASPSALQAPTLDVWCCPPMKAIYSHSRLISLQQDSDNDKPEPDISNPSDFVPPCHTDSDKSKPELGGSTPSGFVPRCQTDGLPSRVATLDGSEAHFKSEDKSLEEVCDGRDSGDL